MITGTGQFEALTGELGTLAAEMASLRQGIAELSGTVCLLRACVEAGVAAGRKAEREDARRARPRRERPAHLRAVPREVTR